MSKPRTLTELAMREKREAYVQRRDKPGAPPASRLESDAAELRGPDVGPGGEVLREQTFGIGGNRRYVRDTLAQGADRIAEDASIRRTDLLMQPGFDAVAMGIRCRAA